MPSLKYIIAVGALVGALVLGFAAYSVFKTPAEASVPIQAISLAESATSSPSADTTAATSAATTEAPAATDTQPTSVSAASSDATYRQVQ